MNRSSTPFSVKPVRRYAVGLLLNWLVLGAWATVVPLGCRKSANDSTAGTPASATPPADETGGAAKNSPSAAGKAQKRPDVLLVVIDTLRADHCSIYGYRRKTTPQLERIASEGILFEAAYAPTATTASSHATLFTGLYPYGHGTLKNGHEIKAKNVLVSEIFKKLGYTTGGFVSTEVLNEKNGFGQGYDMYVAGKAGERLAEETVNGAIEWIDEQDKSGRDPIFVFLHFRDPHNPYSAPETFGDPFGYQQMEYASYDQMVARYDTEIAYSDRHLGRFVDRFEAFAGDDGALMVITADHGESFLEHGWRGHGAQIYEENVRIPLLIRWKGHLDGPKVVKSYVGLVDLLPTMLSLVGVLPEASIYHGEDISGYFTDADSPDSDRYLFFQRRPYENAGLLKARKLGWFDKAEKPVVFGEGIYVAGDKYAVRFGKWKYLEAREEDTSAELYDIEADPGETNNLADQYQDLVSRGSRQIAHWRRETAKAGIALPKQHLTPEKIRQLEDLGYFEPEGDEDEPAESAKKKRKKKKEKEKEKKTKKKKKQDGG